MSLIQNGKGKNRWGNMKRNRFPSNAVQKMPAEDQEGCYGPNMIERNPVMPV
jgi:hypothetical protein